MAIGTGLAMLAGSAVSGVASASAAKKSAKAQTAAADQATKLQREQFEQTTANFAPFLGAGKDAMSAYLYEMGLGPKPVFGGSTPTIETIKGQAGGSVFSTDNNGRPVFKKSTPTPETYRVNGQTFSTLGEAQKFADDNKVAGKEYGGYSQSPMAKYLMEEGMSSIEGGAAASGGLFSGATLEALEGKRQQVISADTSDYFSKLFGLTNMGMSAAGNQANAGSAYAGNVGNLAMAAGQAKGQGYMGAANALNGFIGDAAVIAGYFGQQNNPMAAYAAPTMTGPKPNPYY